MEKGVLDMQDDNRQVVNGNVIRVWQDEETKLFIAEFQS